MDEAAGDRSRRTIGEIVRDSDGNAVFRYLKHSEDFELARKHGFQGFPAFDIRQPETSNGVIESLLRRLPPRNRDDFVDFLKQHRLPAPFTYSDFVLLAYTGAKLPSDGFAVVPDFDVADVPCEYITEVAGVRHVFLGDISAVRMGDPISFGMDTKNEFDRDAIEVLWREQRIGFVNRAMRCTFGRWLARGRVTGAVERVNGRPDRPLLYVRVLAT